MKRISTDAEYLDSGKVVIDADGIPFEPAAKSDLADKIAIKIIGPDDNIDDYVTPGTYWQQSNVPTTPENGYPEGAFRGTLEVVATAFDPVAQTFTDSVRSRVWTRERYNSTWQPWVEVNLPKATDIGAIDLNSALTIGTFYARTANAKLERNYPMAQRGVLEVAHIAGQNTVVQRYTASRDRRTFVREFDSGVWSEWVEQGARHVESSSSVLAYENHVRERDLRRRIGPIRTGGKAAVTIVMDHGEINFRDIIFPALKARGIPATLAVNAGRLDPGYTSTVTSGNVGWDVLKGWNQAGIEIANHSWSHMGATGEANTYREVEESRQKIATEIGDDIDSWVQNGIPAGGWNFDGFGTGVTPNAYLSTYAGRRIMASHPVALGETYNMGEGNAQTHPLDGTIPVGAMGVWLDGGGAAVDKVKESIDVAVDKTRRVIVRMHPGELHPDGTAGKLQTSEFLDFLDYLVARRDAGELEILTLRQWAIAEIGEPDDGYITRSNHAVEGTVGGRDFAARQDSPLPAAWSMWASDGRVFPSPGTYRVEARGMKAGFFVSYTGRPSWVYYRSSGVVTVGAGDYIIPTGASGTRVSMSIKVLLRASTVLSGFADKDEVEELARAVPVTGTGSPEGVVAAPVGTSYVDTTATAGAVRWIKASGTDTTGWRVDWGDTGWRNLPFPADSPYTGGRMLVKRTAVGVYLTFDAVTWDSTATTNESFGRLPSGFRGEDVEQKFSIFAGESPSPVGSVNISRLGYGSIYGDKTDSSTSPWYAQIFYSTSDPWPETLPGTPA